MAATITEARNIEALADAMTLNEQVALLSGEDFWSLPAIARLGIGKLRVSDGPNGARGAGSFVGGMKSASFPVGIALGATWDPGLVREIGAALAEEPVQGRACTACPHHQHPALGHQRAQRRMFLRGPRY